MILVQVPARQERHPSLVRPQEGWMLSSVLSTECVHAEYMRPLSDAPD